MKLPATIFTAYMLNAEFTYARITKSKTDKINVPASPPLPGVSNAGPKPKVILAQDTNYPPYASLGADLELTGFGPDFARGLEEVCNIDVTLVETRWSDCWKDESIGDKTVSSIGDGLLSGHYHGCTTYTGTLGVRQRFVEFSAPILASNKAAGILTRLDNGEPVVDGTSSLSGVNVGDVPDWAPTADTLGIVQNLCTGETFSGYNLVTPAVDNGANANDAALTGLLNGDYDALWIYADQAAIYKAACEEDDAQEWDCTLWTQFGTGFAYVQTGILNYQASGTTLALSKKGSGLAGTLNPCIEAFIETESYFDLCVEYGQTNDCFQNEFFGEPSGEVQPYSLATNELTTNCAEGYCSCPL